MQVFSLILWNDQTWSIFRYNYPATLAAKLTYEKNAANVTRYLGSKAREEALVIIPTAMIPDDDIFIMPGPKRAGLPLSLSRFVQAVQVGGDSGPPLSVQMQEQGEDASLAGLNRISVGYSVEDIEADEEGADQS